MMTTSRSRSTSRMRRTASTPSMPGGMRTSTKATAMGSLRSCACVTAAQPSSPVRACRSSRGGNHAPDERFGGSMKAATRSSDAAVVRRGSSISRKSSWICS